MDESPSRQPGGTPSQPGGTPRPPRRKIWLLLNARAAVDARLRQAVCDVRDFGHEVDVCAIWEPGQAERLACVAAGSGADVVVAAGGDGTMNEALNGLHASGRDDVALGVLPYGTANDFARLAGLLPCDVRDLLRFIAEDEPVPIDVGRINDRLFLNVASGGLSAEITTQTPRLFKDVLGGLAYSIIGMQRLLGASHHNVCIRTASGEWSGEVLFVTVGNGRYAGGGFEPAPRAVLDDGLLDLGYVPNVPPESFPQLLSELFILGRVDSEFVRYEQVPWVELSCSDTDGMQFNADGEPLRGSSFRFEVLPARRPVYVLQPAPLAHATPAGLCSSRHV